MTPPTAGAAYAVRQIAQPALIDVDIVIPVYNEERALAHSVKRLQRFLRAEMPFSCRIIIADNASTDTTPD
jgi:glycosyltransferase involved in cell wall biosynthesis